MEQRYEEATVVNQIFSVLHVDGDMLMRKILKKIFSDELFHLDSAADGKEAFRFLEHKQYDYDIVITEMHMHYANGYEIVNRIRRQAPGCTVIITSNMSFLHIHEGIHLIRENYFKKPLIVGKLMERIRAIQQPGKTALNEISVYTPAIQMLSSAFENDAFRIDVAPVQKNGTELIVDQVPVASCLMEDDVRHPPEILPGIQERITETVLNGHPNAGEVTEMAPPVKPINSPIIPGKRWW